MAEIDWKRLEKELREEHDKIPRVAYDACWVLRALANVAEKMAEKEGK
jgi:hypothetical protein